MDARRITSWDDALEAVSDWNVKFYVPVTRRLSPLREARPDVGFGFAIGDINLTLWLEDMLLDFELSPDGNMRYSYIRINDLAAVQIQSQLSENGIPTNATLQALHQPSGNQWYWTGSDPKATALVLEFGDRLIPIIGGRHADGA